MGEKNLVNFLVIKKQAKDLETGSLEVLRIRAGLQSAKSGLKVSNNTD